MNIFDIILVNPILNLLLIVYHVLLLAHIPYALGFAIIGVTIIIRLFLAPLTASQLKASKKMQDLAPHISHVKAKHKGDNTRIQQETMKLYKEHGVNPAAGCLPVLLQLPLLWALYSVLQHVVSVKAADGMAEVNKIAYLDIFRITQPWETTFFGIPLGQSPSQLLSTVGPLILLVPLLTAFFQFIQSKMMFAPAITPPVTPAKGKKNKQATEKKPEDFATAFQSQAVYIFPLMIGFFSFQLPFGLSLYWNTFTIFGILQQYQLQGLGGLAPYTEKLFKRKK